MSRITPSQMSARSYRKPRTSKTQSSLEARGPVWERSHRPLCPGFWDMQKPVGSQPEGKLQDRPAAGLLTAAPHLRPLPLGAHCAMLLPNHQAPVPTFSSALGLCPGCWAKLGLMKLFPGGWGRLGAPGAGPGGPSALCSLPLLLWSSGLRSGGGAWQMSQKQLLGVGAQASPGGRGHCEGAKKLPGPGHTPCRSPTL